MKRRLMAIIAAVCSVQGLTLAEQTLAERIKGVEQGLCPAVQIGNRPVWTLAERMKHLRVPGVGIAVIRDYQVDWAKSYGLRDAKSGDPVTEATLFQVASITKTLTAVTALRLVEEGLLELDRNVNEYLKSWKVPENEFTRKEKVTLRRLLSHNAGLTVSGFRGYAEGESVPTILQVLDGLPPANNAPIRVDKKPGSGYRYSGGGYTVLQLLIEEVSGLPLAKLVRESILEPLGMKDSTLDPTEEAARDWQLAMAHTGDGTAKSGHRFLIGGSGCCELWTTPSDLARFAITLQRALKGQTDSVLSPEMAKMMMTPSSSPEMGLGFRLVGEGTPAYFAHSGGNVGFSSLLVASMESGEGLVVTTNSNSNIPTEILYAAAKMHGWEKLMPFSFESLEAMTGYIRELREQDPNNERVTEIELNRLGYLLLHSGRVQEAAEVFRLNADFYPHSANAQDSLAEALETAGDTKAALAHYRQALVNLNRYPEANASYERNRKAVHDKIAKLEEKLKEK